MSSDQPPGVPEGQAEIADPPSDTGALKETKEGEKDGEEKKTEDKKEEVKKEEVKKEDVKKEEVKKEDVPVEEGTGIEEVGEAVPAVPIEEGSGVKEIAGEVVEEGDEALAPPPESTRRAESPWGEKEEPVAPTAAGEGAGADADTAADIDAVAVAVADADAAAKLFAATAAATAAEDAETISKLREQNGKLMKQIKSFSKQLDVLAVANGKQKKMGPREMRDGQQPKSDELSNAYKRIDIYKRSNGVLKKQMQELEGAGDYVQITRLQDMCTDKHRQLKKITKDRDVQDKEIERLRKELLKERLEMDDMPEQLELAETERERQVAQAKKYKNKFEKLEKESRRVQGHMVSLNNKVKKLKDKLRRVKKGGPVIDPEDAAERKVSKLERDIDELKMQLMEKDAEIRLTKGGSTAPGPSRGSALTYARDKRKQKQKTQAKVNSYVRNSPSPGANGAANKTQELPKIGSSSTDDNYTDDEH